MTKPRPSTESELVDFVRSIDASAPASLHREVEGMIAARSPRAARRQRARGAARSLGAGRSSIGPRLAAGGASAALVAVAIAIALSGGGGATLSVRDASAPTLRQASAGPPAEANRTELAAAVDGVSFPYWEARFGWRSTGARSDRIDGRTVTTIFYANGRGQRIGYAIVAGTPAPRTSGGIVSWRDGRPYRLLRVHGVPVVAWLRDGHLCIVSGRGVDGATLVRLASWDDRGTVAS
jgi:hypothetical protein